MNTDLQDIQNKPRVAAGVQNSSLTMPDRAGRQVLLVDDNADAADMLGALLRMDGFSVSTAYDGQTAVEAVKTAAPDVVVMDIGMPGLSGYEAARMMREQPGGQRIVLVALTGWGQSSDKKSATEAGFNHHLVKPVAYDTLLKCLQL